MNENVIPWSDIEPLVQAGMRGRDLRVALLTRVGLDPERYRLRSVTRYFSAAHAAATDPLQDMRNGLEIVKTEDVLRDVDGAVDRSGDVLKPPTPGRA